MYKGCTLVQLESNGTRIHGKRFGCSLGEDGCSLRQRWLLPQAVFPVTLTAK